jgi:type I site-specific restriction-modification system R (restriction) subunit
LVAKQIQNVTSTSSSSAPSTSDIEKLREVHEEALREQKELVIVTFQKLSAVVTEHKLQAERNNTNPVGMYYRRVLVCLVKSE